MKHDKHLEKMPLLGMYQVKPRRWSGVEMFSLRREL
jgi:hypothetical protein